MMLSSVAEQNHRHATLALNGKYAETGKITGASNIKKVRFLNVYRVRLPKPTPVWV
jgi:hypothetical protein